MLSPRTVATAAPNFPFPNQNSRCRARRRFARAALPCIILACALDTAPVRADAPTGFHMQPVGLADAEFLTAAGARSSFITGATPAGMVYGTSQRYSGTSGYTGSAAWLLDPADNSTTRLGFAGSGYIRASDNYMDSLTSTMSPSGQYLAGRSTAYMPPYYETYHAWLYNTATRTTTFLGLTDAKHTSTTGMTYSTPLAVNDLGFAAGIARNYVTGDFGESVWHYNPLTGQTTRLGATSATYTGPSGTQYSSLHRLFTSGSAVGASAVGVSNGSLTTWTNSLVWYYSRFTNLQYRLGFTTSEYTRADGYQLSSIVASNVNGFVTGTSQRWSGSTALGRKTWFFNANTGQQFSIGIAFDAETSPTGVIVSTPLFMNASGVIGGESTRYDTTPNGTTAWVYNPADNNSFTVGYYDGSYLYSGAKINKIHAVSDAGYVTGYTQFTVGSSINGKTAWIVNAATHTQSPIGLYGAAYLDSQGAFANTPKLLNAQGVAVGTTARFNGIGITGYSAWVYHPDEGITRQIGLPDAAHMTASAENNTPLAITDTGRIPGTATRLGGLGTNTWLYSPATHNTKLVGLTDARHTSSNGTQNSAFLATTLDSVNADGYAIGTSTRYLTNSTLTAGQSAWVYDPLLDATIPLVLSQKSNGYADSEPLFLSESGFVVGQYHLYNASDVDLGVRPFYWSHATGVADLETLIAGGILPAGFAAMSNGATGDDFNRVFGMGTLSSTGYSAYLLTATPEPTTLATLSISLAALLIRRPGAGVQRRR